MGEIIEVVHGNGVLKPLKPLKFKEGQRLRVRVYSDDFLEFLKNHGWEEDEILDPSKVAPYLFDNNEEYTKIRELEIFKDEGISSEAFYYTIMELLKETEELTELLSRSSEK
ncbi:antitoxin family protein [Thermococcus sp.]